MEISIAFPGLGKADFGVCFIADYFYLKMSVQRDDT